MVYNETYNKYNNDVMINCCDTSGIANSTTCNVMLNKNIQECNISGFNKSNCFNSNTSLWIDTNKVVCSPCREPKFCDNAALDFPSLFTSSSGTITTSSTAVCNLTYAFGSPTSDDITYIQDASYSPYRGYEYLIRDNVLNRNRFHWFCYSICKTKITQQINQCDSVSSDLYINDSLPIYKS